MKAFSLKDPVVIFLVITFALTWVVGLGLAFVLQALDLGINSEHYTLIAKYGPSISGLLTAYFVFGKGSCKSLFLKAFRWKSGWQYWAIALFSPIFVLLLLMVVIEDSVSFVLIDAALIWSILLVLLQPLFLGGGFGEEFGWRGLMLPELMKDFSPLTSSIIIGFFWFLWHVPAFILFGKGSNEPMLGFFFLCMGLSVIFTWFYYKTNESILLVALFHASINASTTIASIVAGVDSAVLENSIYFNWMVAVIFSMAVIIALTFGQELGTQKKKKIDSEFSKVA